jgi:protocatechuate 3,4-dioxygenase beta subunit
MAAWCLALTILLIVDLGDIQSAENKEAKQVTCTGKVTDEQGRPIDGIKVSLLEMVYDEATYTYDPNLLGQVQTKTHGVFSFEETIEDNQYRYAYIVAEKEGLALGFDNWSLRDGDKEPEISLGRPKELAGIVVDENDKPVPDAEVAVMLLFLGEGKGQKHLNSIVVPKLLVTNTDAAGKFAFTRIPAGATVEFIAKKPDRATVSTYKRPGGPYEKLNFTEGQRGIKLVLPVEAKIEGLVVEKTTGKPVGGVKIRYSSGQEAGYFRPKPLISKNDGTFGVDALMASRYVIELVQPRDRLPDWVAEPVEVITEVGKTKSGIKIELSKGGVLEVKVTDAVTKEPVENTSVGVNNHTTNQYSHSRSDENGMARMRLMPGDYQLTSLYKQGYSQQRLQDTITIEDGKTESLEYELAGMSKITGVVFDEQGKPIEGVEMEICPGGGRKEGISDAEGKFEVTYDLVGWPSGRTPTIFLVGRHIQRNLAAAAQVDEDTRQLDMKLQPAVTLFGVIVGPDGKGIADAEVWTMLRGPQWGSTLGRKPAITDKEGKYEIMALPLEHPYNVYARADGYGESHGEEISAENTADNRLDMGELTLTVANLPVSGIVVDYNDKPVVGARIFCYGDNQPHRDTQTDIEGKFTIEKVCAGRIRISADKTGAKRLYGYIETEGGATDIRIVISERPTSTRYEPRRPPSLVGRPLPELKDVGINLSTADTDDKILLVSFFDMEQRPSRHCLTQLVKQAEQLKGKGVTVVAVQASKIDQEDLNQWVKKYNIPFPVGMVQNDEKKTRFNWGVKSLPWLILTDQKHIVEANGFPLAELDEKI